MTVKKKSKKPVLKSKTTTYVEVDYHDLDEFIQKVYNITSFECLATEEWSNDSQHRMNVDKKEELGEWDLDKLQGVKDGKLPNYSLRTVMQDLVNRDLIAPAIYLINVCW
jgi:hypothetical protein